MGIYNFKAKDVNKRIVRGRVRAQSTQEVKEKLISRQLTLVHAVPESDKPSFFSSIGKVKTKHLVIATRQMAFLVNAGVPIVQALDTVSQNTDDPALKKIFIDISKQVESGQNFSTALKKHKNAFNDLYVNMIKSGEEGGSIDVMLNQLAVYIEKVEKIKGKVKAAMMYPGFIMVAATVIVLGIIYFLVPQFEAIFKQAGQELPGITQIIVNFSGMLRDHYLILIGSVIGAVMGILYFIKTPVGANLFEIFISKVPGVGILHSKNSIARYSRTLACLLASGVGIVETIRIGGKASGSIRIANASNRMAIVVESGYGFGKALRKETIFPDLIKNMVAVGEETGNLDNVLGKVADFYEEQVETAVEGLLKLIEPVLIVGVGGIIAFILVALYLPIFKISGTIG